ncbi:MAG: single-stranded DNA-binding protein [Oscillospiraceae bacterium]|nr:single-stranded DNA-binding protein [Oscillospiraceae bacterium]
MLNKVIIMGRLVADPEFRQTTSGIPVCRIRVAVDRPFRKDQERQTDFINVTCWRNTAEFVSRYFSKGKMIIVEGSLRNNDYTDNNGVKHYSMEVQADNVMFGESKGSSQGGDYSQQGSYQQQGGYQGGGYQQNGGGYQNNSYQNAPAAPQQDALSIGDIGEFEEILSDGEVPF